MIGVRVSLDLERLQKIIPYTKMSSARIYLPKDWEGHKVLIIRLSKKPVIERITDGDEL